MFREADTEVLLWFLKGELRHCELQLSRMWEVLNGATPEASAGSWLWEQIFLRELRRYEGVADGIRSIVGGKVYGQSTEGS